MIGRTISHYRITRKLGAGGMGVVYQAVDTKLDRTIALKFLPPESTSDPDAKARFIHEAKAVSALDHPNVCTLFEIDETDYGEMFLVMACYEGETLKDRIARGPLPLDEAVDITRQIAEGLACAHEQDIVHRDIKPANIFLDEGGLAKILDFGLAKLTKGTKVTKTGTTLGTAGYMSPEQARGDATDPRTDLWCLGAVLFEMVTGRLPFPGDQEQAIIYAILNMDPDPVTGLRTGVPMELERIIGKCLTKDPAERYQHAEDLVADLLHLRRETELGSTVTMQRQGTRVKRRRWPWMLGSIIALVLATAYGIQYITNGSEESHSEMPMLAVLPFENLGNPEDEYFSDGITDEIIVRLTGIEGLCVIARTSNREFKNSKRPMAEIGEELGAEYILVGTIRWQRQNDGTSDVSIAPKLIRAEDGTHLWADVYREDLSDVFDVQSKIALLVAEAMGIELLPEAQSSIGGIPTTSQNAYDLYLRGLDYETKWSNSEYAKKAVRLYEAAVSIDPEFAVAWGKICHLHAWLVNTGKSDHASLQKAKAAGDRALAIDVENVEGHVGLGFYYYYGFRDYENALRYFERAIDLSPGRTEAIYGKALVLRRMGMYELSMAELERVLMVDPRNSNVLLDASWSASYVRDFEKQEMIARQMVEIEPDDPDAYQMLIDAFINIDGDTIRAARVLDRALEKGPLWLVGQDMSSARALYARAGASKSLIMQMEALPDWSILQRAYLEFMKATIYRDRDDGEAARSGFLKVAELLEPKILAHPGVYFNYPALVGSYSGLGHHDDAIELCWRGLAEERIAEDDINSKRLRHDLAAALATAGRELEAIDVIAGLLESPSGLNAGKLKADPVWDPLRDNPRFQELITNSP